MVNLNEMRINCSNLQICCHKNINRILELMVQHSEFSQLLNEYAKKSLVLEKLCDYVCNCCCNNSGVSRHLQSELKQQCKSMSSICNKLIKTLPSNKSKYIRCDVVSKMCLLKNNKKSRKV